MKYVALVVLLVAGKANGQQNLCELQCEHGGNPDTELDDCIKCVNCDWGWTGVTCEIPFKLDEECLGYLENEDRDQNFEQCLSRCNVEYNAIFYECYEHCEETCYYTKAPTSEPTEAPTSRPTPSPTYRPSVSPTEKPSKAPTSAKPTMAPTPFSQNAEECLGYELKQECTEACFYEHQIYFEACAYHCDTTCELTDAPTAQPSYSPTSSPSEAPTQYPSKAPTTTNPTTSPTPFAEWAEDCLGEELTVDCVNRCGLDYPVPSDKYEPCVHLCFDTCEPTDSPTTAKPTPSPSSTPTHTPTEVPTTSTPTEAPSFSSCLGQSTAKECTVSCNNLYPGDVDNFLLCSEHCKDTCYDGPNADENTAYVCDSNANKCNVCGTCCVDGKRVEDGDPFSKKTSTAACKECVAKNCNVCRRELGCSFVHGVNIAAAMIQCCDNPATIKDQASCDSCAVSVEMQSSSVSSLRGTKLRFPGLIDR